MTDRDYAELAAAASATQKLMGLQEQMEHGGSSEWFTRDHFEADDWPKAIAEYLALCSPPAILALLADVRRLREENETKERELDIAARHAVLQVEEIARLKRLLSDTERDVLALSGELEDWKHGVHRPMSQLDSAHSDPLVWQLVHAQEEITALRAQLRQAEEGKREAESLLDSARRRYDDELGQRKWLGVEPPTGNVVMLGEAQYAALTQQRDALVALLHQPHFGDLAACRAAPCVDARAVVSGKA